MIGDGTRLYIVQFEDDANPAPYTATELARELAREGRAQLLTSVTGWRYDDDQDEFSPETL